MRLGQQKRMFNLLIWLILGLTVLVQLLQPSQLVDMTSHTSYANHHQSTTFQLTWVDEPPQLFASNGTMRRYSHFKSRRYLWCRRRFRTGSCGPSRKTRKVCTVQYSIRASFSLLTFSSLSLLKRSTIFLAQVEQPSFLETIFEGGWIIARYRSLRRFLWTFAKSLVLTFCLDLNPNCAWNGKA